MKLTTLLLCLACITLSQAIFAAPNLNGETGYINMPSGRIEPDGTFRMGYAFNQPYSNMWSSVTLLPRVELYARYVRIMNIRGGEGDAWLGYGDYKDKVSSARFLLSEESWYWPSLALGVNDIQGTGLFDAKYLAASKRFGDVDTTLGYGSGRIDGWFAGARYSPDVWRGVSLVAEYDANNYRKDAFSEKTGVAQRDKGLGLALEYRWGWLGSQLALKGGRPAINAYATIPFEVKEFIPKIDEPAPDTDIVERPTLQQWQADSQYQRALLARLLEQDFKSINIQTSNYVLDVTLTNNRISLASRAVGRAVRTLLLRAPQEIREIRVNYTIQDMPFARYTFFDIGRLRQYLNGFISRKELAPYVAIEYANPSDIQNDAVMNDIAQEYQRMRIDGNDGNLVSLRAEGAGLSQLRIVPGAGVYFNDPSGAFRYEVFAAAGGEKQLSQGLFLRASTQLTLHQTISGVQQKSNSSLPHVRTDVAEYKKNGDIKLTQLMVNRFFHPKQRIYARASAGLYEEMFGGAGGQVLYYPERSPWAIDVSVDALRQRDVGGGLRFRDYSTLTALAALHYRLPLNGVTATVRAGRFLAGDEGARFEFKRQFRSGFQFGAWYSLTNGHDETSPGKPGQPYYDKGVFLSIPLRAMLTKDTSAAPAMSLSPWTRDVAQMVASPGDLYAMLEPAYVNMHDKDGLQYFADMDDSYSLASSYNVMDRLSLRHVRNDGLKVANALSSADTWLWLGAGLGVSALASKLDQRGDNWVVSHDAGNKYKWLVNSGNGLPFALGAVSGLLAMDGSEPRLASTSFSALEAGMMGVAASQLAKYAFGRARPEDEEGSQRFYALDNRYNSSFPSMHTTLSWALVTPYAKEYDMPWLYGLATFTNVARILDRKHWFSDTLGGALLGYAIGDAAWRWHRESGPKVSVESDRVKLSWTMK